ncbi:hypothetical protein FHS43_006347 [Streptosporangium becharense]|uniref:Putative cupin superfamily protein n=1 Tax=Streptosporangium becharense TaxID=1816182 RepID=A0A7W9MF27_9ACTN|nr:cupin domain-containing protein [Streptosporangium becharense]MBB2915032.1 hypothetical protein [Streptosporangium becharense]MBB5818081.1 putative cupin superfamily protein [Streptosporangium becharense]
MTAPIENAVPAPVGIDDHDARDLPLTPTGSPQVVVSGDPRTAEHVLHESPEVEVGVWEVTPGVFDSRKAGCSEIMHFLSGEGRLDHADGTHSDIRPGVTVILPEGWTGRWTVTSTVRKIYTICRVTAATPEDA